MFTSVDTLYLLIYHKYKYTQTFTGSTIMYNFHNCPLHEDFEIALSQILCMPEDLEVTPLICVQGVNTWRTRMPYACERKWRHLAYDTEASLEMLMHWLRRATEQHWPGVYCCSSHHSSSHLAMTITGFTSENIVQILKRLP